ncbi:MAG: hypothetical protein RLN60_01810 [Phycisphaerales bacterium]
MPESPDTDPLRIAGTAHAMFAFDIGFQVDLDAAERLVSESSRQRVLRGRRPAPVWFDYSPPPLRLTLEGSSVSVGAHETESSAEILVYDFGAALLTYRIALPETLDGLAAMSTELYDHAALEADARARVRSVIEVLGSSIERARLNEASEDYVAYAITSWSEGVSPREAFERSRMAFAKVIEAERVELSEEQALRSTEGVMSYATSDLAVIDWNASILFDAAPDDVISVLQHANIELLELRVLDQELDEILDHADETLAVLSHKMIWPGFSSGAMLARFASVQTDAAVMFEGVNNAIKLLGNQYLARLYRLAAERLDLGAWQESVRRKLDVTESLYGKMSDTTSTRRLETLEWVIIALIAVSIALPFTPWYH